MFICILCSPAEDLWAKQQKRTFSGVPISSADYKVFKKRDNYWKDVTGHI